MVLVEGGTLGATYQTHLSSFSIGRYEVTQEEWEFVMGNNPSHFKGAKLPVENVSWNDCQLFISKLNYLTGKEFRLPTEAEWEFAARGGNKSQGYKYAGSSSFPEKVAWYIINSNSQTHKVGEKEPNELGLYDMSGNVWEWCNDCYPKYSNYKKYKYRAMFHKDSPLIEKERVCRGGCWSNDSERCGVSSRNKCSLDNRYSGLGLRLAL